REAARQPRSAAASTNCALHPCDPGFVDDYQEHLPGQHIELLHVLCHGALLDGNAGISAHAVPIPWRFGTGNLNRWTHWRPIWSEICHVVLDSWRHPACVAAPLCRPYLDLRAECLDRPHLRIGVSRHRGVCTATDPRQGRYDRRHLFWPGFRRGWIGRSSARHRGGCSGNHICLLAVLFPAIAWVVDRAAARRYEPIRSLTKLFGALIMSASGSFPLGAAKERTTFNKFENGRNAAPPLVK